MLAKSSFGVRYLAVALGVIVVGLLYVGWVISWGKWPGPYMFVLMLAVVGALPFVVGEGLSNRAGHSRLWLGLFGFVIGLIAGWNAAELVDMLTHVPNPELDTIRMRLDLGFGAIVGASLFSSLGVLLGSRPPRPDQTPPR